MSDTDLHIRMSRLLLGLVVVSSEDEGEGPALEVEVPQSLVTVWPQVHSEDHE